MKCAKSGLKYLPVWQQLLLYRPKCSGTGPVNLWSARRNRY